MLQTGELWELRSYSCSFFWGYLPILGAEAETLGLAKTKEFCWDRRRQKSLWWSCQAGDEGPQHTVTFPIKIFGEVCQAKKLEKPCQRPLKAEQNYLQAHHSEMAMIIMSDSRIWSHFVPWQHFLILDTTRGRESGLGRGRGLWLEDKGLTELLTVMCGWRAKIRNFKEIKKTWLVFSRTFLSSKAAWSKKLKNVTKLLKSRENLNAISQLKVLDVLIWDRDKPEVYYILSENANTSWVILCPNLLQVLHFITLRA